MSGEDRVEKAKFELGGAGAGDSDIDAGNLPWGYGDDRITALVVDPESAYVCREPHRRGDRRDSRPPSARQEPTAGATSASTT